MTQHNAALVEETNAAIEQTEAQAVELDKIVEVFDFGGDGAQPERAAPKLTDTGRNVHQKVRQASRTYLSQGNAALKSDWSEF